MRRLFLQPGSLDTTEIRIAGAYHHHLAHVLRVKPGESLILLDGAGVAKNAVIASVEKHEIIARITGVAPYPPRPPFDVTVAQALGKGDRFEQVIQHATELGAGRFIPLITERTVVKLEGRGKADRWAAVARGAAEQSGRGEVPEVESSLDFSGVLATLSEFRMALLLDASGAPLSRIVSHRPHVEQSPCILLVGPEGGFTPDEVRSAQASGAQVASIGPFILRTETAAVAALSQLLILHAGEEGWTTP